MEKLDLTTPNFTDENIAKLAELFPNCVTETKGDDGEVKHAIDFDALRQEFSSTIVEGPVERYSLNWPGKREALVTANTPISKTLRPCREESVDFDTTKNIFIEGDNLDALKLLQESYLGKVKMIYIDPPYNTGKDFIYSDNFTADKAEFDEASSQKDEEGGRLVANPDSNGRYHSDWLSMMYPRLKLSKNLLSNDGIIFISINHKELANLRKVMDEIYSEDNLLCMFAWRTDGNFDNQAKFKYCHEYILAYAKQESSFPHPLIVDPNTPSGSKIFKSEIRNTIVKNGPKNPPSQITLPVGFPASFETGVVSPRSDSWPQYLGEAQIENFKLVKPVTVYSGWSSKDLVQNFINVGCVEILDAKDQSTTFEIISSGAIEAVKSRGKSSHVISMLTSFGGPQRATTELEKIGVIFDDYPKPLGLIKYFMQMNQGNNFVALDFFAGSATTAHSAMELNAKDGGSRKFIMVQLPELCNEASEAQKAGYKNIAEISKERIRRAGKQIKEEHPLESQNLDIGFRVFKIDSSNMQDVHLSPDETKPDMLEELEGNIKADRTGEDLLFQVLLDWGVDLSLPIESQTIDGKTVYFVDSNALAACFDEGINEDFVKELAAKQPLRVVFRDDGFASDSVKINVEQIFKLKSPSTDIRVI